MLLSSASSKDFASFYELFSNVWAHGMNETSWWTRGCRHLFSISSIHPEKTRVEMTSSHMRSISLETFLSVLFVPPQWELLMYFLSKVHVTIGYKINSHKEVTLADHWYNFKASGNTTPSVQRKRTKQRRYALPCWSTDSMCGSPGSQRAYPGKFQTGFFTEIFTSLILYVQHCFPCHCNKVIKQLKERRVCFGSQLEGTVCRGPKGLESRVRGCWSH